MKKYCLIALCMVPSLHSAEKPNNTPTITPWDAELYNKGNFVQEKAFLYFFDQSGIDLKYKKKLLDIGSGTGNISGKLANYENLHVTAFDQCPNMVKFAQKNMPPNVSFHQAFAETFKFEQKYDCAIMSFVFHWIQNKQQALRNISDHLQSGADFFFTAHAHENPKPLNLIVPEEMMQDSWFVSAIKFAASWFAEDQAAAIGATYPTMEELQAMVENADFEIITLKESTSKVIIPDRKSLEDFQRPIVMSRPIVQKIPEMLHEWLFSSFIDKLIERMEKTTDGKYIENITTTVIHARKK